MEQVIDWLNENENRAFPLIEDAPKTTSAGWVLADNVILDAQIIYLNKVLDTPVLIRTISSTPGTDGGVITFSFGSQSTSAVTFSLNAPLAQTYPVYIRESTSGSLLVVGEKIKDTPIIGQSISVSLNIPVEPSVCYEFKDAWLGVNSVESFPNKQTLQNSIEPFLPLVNDITSTPLVGHVYFLEGYNFRVNINNELIDLSVGREYGLQMDCTTSFIEAEYLDCDSVVSYINGIPPDSDGNFRILSGDNINVISGRTLDEKIEDLYESAPDAREHSLFVGLTFETTDLCAPINIVPTIE